MSYILLSVSIAVGIFELFNSYKAEQNGLATRNYSIGAYLLLATLILLYAGTASNPDIGVYQGKYNSPTFLKSDCGFGLLIFIIKSIGISYKGLIVTVALLGIGLIHDVARRYLKGNELFVLYILYLIHPFFYDVIQVRNFLAAALMIYSIHELSKEEIKHTVISFVLILLSVSIHFAAVAYVPFLLFYRIVKDKKKREYILYTLAGIVILFLSNKFTVYKVMDLFTSNELFSKGRGGYFRKRDNSPVGYFYWIIVLLNVVLLWVCIKLQKKSRVDEDSKSYKFSYIVYLINIYFIPFYPLLFLRLDFYRIERNLLFMNYIVIIDTYGKIKKNDDISRKERNLFIFFVVFLVIFSFSCIYIFCFGHADEFKRIVLPILNKNWIFNPNCPYEIIP